MSPAVLLAVALGSALGGSLRHLAALGVGGLDLALPWATLAVNLLGSAGIALFAAGAAALGRDLSAATRHFVMTGVMGGFTTFSLMSLDTLALAASGRWGLAGAYVVASAGGALLAAWAGDRLGRRFARRPAG